MIQTKNLTLIISILVLITISLAAYAFWQKQETTMVPTEQSQDTAVPEVDQTEVMFPDETQDVNSEFGMTPELQDQTSSPDLSAAFDYVGELVDVTGGESARSITTGGKASGISRASFQNGTYILHAQINNLTDPSNGEFYEGWAVRKNPPALISTGKLEKVGESYINEFSSQIDYTSYTDYVLTIEPDDGNPAPDTHVVEGVMIKVR